MRSPRPDRNTSTERGFMSPALVRGLRRYAHGTKGLDQETYRLQLESVGARSTLQLTRHQHNMLMERLRALPDRRRGGTPE